MIRYDIRTLPDARYRRKGRVTMEPIEAPLGFEKDLERELRVLLRILYKAISADVLPVVEREMATRRRAMQDAIDESMFTRLYALAASLLRGRATNMVNRILRLQSQKFDSSFMAKAKKALGIDLSSVVRGEDLTETLETAATRQAGLIKNLLDSFVQKVQTRVTTAVLTGQSAANLKKLIAKDLGISDRRAKVIARDQISKVNSELTILRHTQAGISKYEWVTAHDERVRPLHRSIDGNTYQYGKPTGAEEGLPPGQPILCRCVGRPIIEF